MTGMVQAFREVCNYLEISKLHKANPEVQDLRGMWDLSTDNRFAPLVACLDRSNLQSWNLTPFAACSPKPYITPTIDPRSARLGNV